jgi:hypothetical protein
MAEIIVGMNKLTKTRFCGGGLAAANRKPSPPKKHVRSSKSTPRADDLAVPKQGAQHPNEFFVSLNDGMPE